MNSPQVHAASDASIIGNCFGHGISPLIGAKERSAGLKPLISGFKQSPAS
jgi:hypothetical protein